ncbi:ATP-binding protein [Rhodohalobacter mucosus]|uniref:histidine kinase n=1 Tax=Rhodohalobacter mucosus TaxID=2079485 RepID=A0A316TKZ0_9BACT|nr:ATP-binding protein [Rhodohalobacter mucosus]PWN05223.1 hypothetical protein DDZ15_15980 [Rhodohalobacter mucosus]
MKKPGAYPLYVSLTVLVLLLAAYGIFEQFSGEPYKADPTVEDLMEESLNEAVALFNDEYQEFIERSNSLYEDLSTVSVSPQNYGFIFNKFEDYDFWASSLYLNNNQVVWRGFNLTPLPLPDSGGSLRVNIQRRDNVTYLFGQRTLSVEEGTAYLLTARLLEQTINIPLGTQENTRLSNHPRLDGHFPVNFSFLDTPQDEEYSISRALYIQQSDSIGTVYASQGNYSLYKAEIAEERTFWRGLFHLAILIAAVITFIMWNRVQQRPILFVVRAGLLILTWWLIKQGNLIDIWSSYYPDILSADRIVLLNYIFSSILFLLLFLEVYGFTVSAKLRSSRELRPGTFLMSVLYGAGSLGLILFFVLTTRSALLESNMRLLDLELIPETASLFFYISAGVLFTSIGGIIIALGFLLNRWEADKSAILSAGAIFSFALTYYLTDIFLIAEPLFNWIFVLSSIIFLTLLWLVHSIHTNIRQFVDMSGFRKLMVAVLLSSTAAYAIIWTTNSARTDRELMQHSQEFITEETNNTAEIVEDVLRQIESNLLFFNIEDVDVRSQILTGRFQRIVRNSIRPEWRQHTFEIQLLDTVGNVFSDYSTNLDIPGWRSLVNMELMRESHDFEQLQKETNRPIVWDAPPNLGENYISFKRGWIPIYSEQNPEQRIAWVFAAIYRERADYNKPLRAVRAAATAEEWRDSYYLAEFRNGRISRSAMEGIYSNQPEYSRLPAREQEIALRDSIAFITNLTVQGEFREILLKVDQNTIVKASTPIPVLNNHLFSYFRLQMVMIFFGLFIFSLLALSGEKRFSLFSQNRKFRHRLLDGLTLVTIIFLTVLIFATQYAVGNQNAKNVEHDLVTKLNSLSESLWDDESLFGTDTNSGSLTEYASPLNVDAILYNGTDLMESTTPQIFQQYLMPRNMPYTVYDLMYNRERRQYVTTSTLAGEQLLIGYRALLDEQSETIGAVAIPTFIQSPVYRDQLLQTTSYLLGVYLLIFGFFIVGTVLFSTSLTKPLAVIQSALNRISRGDIRGQVEVTSRDEIGSLARAYNQMVERLNEARRELVQAEREAAWKEMAQQVAHEIKNPLTPMKLNLQHLQRQLEANPDNVMELKPVIESTATNIIDQIESLNRIASDFSKFAKPVQDQLQPVNLNRVLGSVCDLYRNDPEVSISLTQPDSPIAILAAEDELRRAFINLVKNGIEAHDSDTARISIFSEVKGDRVLVRIHDDGVGINPETQDKIFVPNFSTKSSGTGLGLAITKKIIEAHNADIWFESKPGEGSTFFISIPSMKR